MSGLSHIRATGFQTLFRALTRAVKAFSHETEATQKTKILTPYLGWSRLLKTENRSSGGFSGGLARSEGGDSGNGGG